MEKQNDTEKTAITSNGVLPEVKPCGWISVKDRLPEIDEKTKFDFGYRSKIVLVLNDGHPYTNDYTFMSDRTKNGWCVLNAPRQNITHWMPIPELSDSKV